MVGGLSTFDVEGVSVPRVLIGVNPFLGYSHFSEARDRYFKRIFSDVKSISDVIVKATELGVRGIFTPADKKIIKALNQTQQRVGVEMTVVGTTYYTFELKKIQMELEFLDAVGTKICLLHGALVDDLLNPVKRIIIRGEEMLGLIRDYGMIPGIACHDARAIVFSDEQAYDVKLYATPVNMLGFKMNPEGFTLRVVRETSKPVIALKPFASGRVPPQEGLRFTLTTPGVEAVAIGVASIEEATQDFQLATELLQDASAMV